MLLGIIIGILITVFAGATFSARVRSIATDAWHKVVDKVDDTMSK